MSARRHAACPDVSRRVARRAATRCPWARAERPDGPAVAGDASPRWRVDRIAAPSRRRRRPRADGPGRPRPAARRPAGAAGWRAGIGAASGPAAPRSTLAGRVRRGPVARSATSRACAPQARLRGRWHWTDPARAARHAVGVPVMRAPDFWWRAPERPGALARALAPAAALWRLGGWLRARRIRPWRAAVPVICVGNLVAGGAGKTPLVTALLPRLAALGLTAHVLSRGHGGRVRGPHRVDPDRDSARAVGDEPLLLAALAPVWVARDRAAGARAAARAGADVIVMDDGLQNPGLVKDLSILAVDAETGFGNGRVIPAGPLREPAAAGLARADLLVLIGPEGARAAAPRRWPLLQTRPRIGAALAPMATGLDLSGLAVVAFAGIARPAKFFATLEGMGARLVARVPFADHQPYAPAVLRRLVAEARRADAMLVTTEKDAVRLPPAFRREVVALPVRLEIDDEAPLAAALARLAGRRPEMRGDAPADPGTR